MSKPEPSKDTEPPPAEGAFLAPSSKTAGPTLASIRSSGTTLLSAAAVIALLHFGRNLFTVFAFALFLSFALRPFVSLLERARMTGEELRSHQATELGLAALDRLLRRAEERDARHRRDILSFLSALWNNRALPLVTLRGLDPAVGDDMLAVLDAFRWGRLSLVEQVEGGGRRFARVLKDWTGASV